MPTQRKPPTDHTGNKRQQLEKEHADEIVRRQGEMAMISHAAAEAASEVVDMVKPDEPLTASAEDAPPAVWETVGGPEVRGPADDGTVVIRVNSDLEDVTIGAGNNYTFMEGQQYRVPAYVAAHLEEKGYVYH